MLLPGQVCVPGGGTSPLVTAADYRRGLIASPDEDDRVLLDRYKIRIGWLQQAREDAKAAGQPRSFHRKTAQHHRGDQRHFGGQAGIVLPRCCL